MGSFSAGLGRFPVEIPSPESEQLLSYMQAGRAPRLANWVRHAGEEPVSVELSVINFMPAYREYQRCQKGLKTFDFEQLKATRIGYGPGESLLPEKSKERLKTIAELINADSKIRQCYIDGYTDNVGESDKNLAVSRRRAEAVKAYLVSHGVDPKRITVRAYGESKWLVDYIYEEVANPAQRRVTVQLER